MAASASEYLSECLLQLPKAQKRNEGVAQTEHTATDPDHLPAHKGVVGYRRMRVYLGREGVYLSAATVYKYMNKELGLRSVVQRNPPKYQGAYIIHISRTCLVRILRQKQSTRNG